MNRFQKCFIFGQAYFEAVSKYSGTASYSNEKSVGFIIPIIVLVFIGVIYIMSQRAGGDFVNFILIGIGAITAIYWVKILKNMIKSSTSQYKPRETETKNWVYDLIKGNNEFVFVAEVPGPDDKIQVRLVEGILYIRGSSAFSKEVPIEGSSQMQISDFKYRNGVLTLRIS